MVSSIPTRSMRASILVLLAGCATSPFATTPPEYRVQGRIVDAETGETIRVELIPRESVRVRFFRDEQGAQAQPMVRAESGDRFDVRLPYQAARIVVDDPRKRYHTHEEGLLVPSGGMEHDVRLRPTHRVLLRGRAIDDRTGGPARLVGGMSAFSSVGDDGAGSVSATPDERGHFEIYVPRSVVEFRYFSPRTGLTFGPTIDLRHVTGEVVERTIPFSFSGPDDPAPVPRPPATGAPR